MEHEQRVVTADHAPRVQLGGVEPDPVEVRRAEFRPGEDERHPVAPAGRLASIHSTASKLCSFRSSREAQFLAHLAGSGFTRRFACLDDSAR